MRFSKENNTQQKQLYFEQKIGDFEHITELIMELQRIADNLRAAHFLTIAKLVLILIALLTKATKELD